MTELYYIYRIVLYVLTAHRTEYENCDEYITTHVRVYLKWSNVISVDRIVLYVLTAHHTEYECCDEYITTHVCVYPDTTHNLTT